MSSEDQSVTFREVLSENRRLAIFIALAIISFIIICVLGAIWIRSSLVGDGDESSTVVDTADSTPTPFPDLPEIPEPVSGEPLIVGISDTDTISVSLDMPVSLSIGNQNFSVRSQALSADNRQWVIGSSGENTAVWVYGSIINYIIGLPDIPATRTLLEQLETGAEIVLTTRGGTDHTFTFDGRNTVSNTSQDIFAQKSPGITLVLVGSEGGERLMVHGRYLVPEASSSRPSNVVELGETAQLENVQLTVTGASYMLDRPESPPGFAFYMVDFEIQNIGLTALDTNSLQFLLMDELGNQYALNPLTSQLGNYPALNGFLNASQMLSATAGYQIPIGLQSTSLNWIVTYGTGNRVQITIPFTGSSTDAQTTDITLYSAGISPDTTSLILGGQVTNLGSQPILVTERDVLLETGDGSVYLLLAINPPFPWTVAPEQTLQFSMTFQRPLTADTAVFTVLNQPFQLSDLR